MTALRTAVPLAAGLVGGWVTVPFAAVTLFAVDGFGYERDHGLRVVTVAGYSGLLLACLAVPLLLAAWLAPRALGWTLATYAAGVATSVVMMGVLG